MRMSGRSRWVCASVLAWSGLVAAGGAQEAADPHRATLVVRAQEDAPEISRMIYGHFAEHLGRCIYGGIWVGEDSDIPNTRGIRDDVVEALKQIRIPVLRWPGGCFADEYHWKDGIGPREERPSMINTHWGGVVENNHFGTHEFMDLCELLGTEPYISGNVGSGTPREMMEWVEYMTSDADSPMANLRRQNGRDEPWELTYFGIGNESWGCGGNMRPEYYADLYRHFNTYVKNYSGNRIFRIACGANGGDYNWTEVLMREVGRRMDGLSVHYYTVPSGNWGNKGSATDFGEPEWHATMRRCLELDRLVARHAEIMDEHDPRGRIGMMVDEWGVWHNVEPGTNPGFLYQQNTLRDALVAAISLNIFNTHSDRVKMANIAQTVNVLQAMILTEDEKMLLTPTFHVYEMYTVHHDATLLSSELDAPDYELGSERVPAVHVSSSRDSEGNVHISLCNLDPARPVELACALPDIRSRLMSGRILTAPAMQAHNTFEDPGAVQPTAFTAFQASDEGFTATLPPKSVVVLAID